MNTFALTVIGKDRPGIVAAVSEGLTRAGCNIEDSQMSILRGHFAMVLIVTGSGETSEQSLLNELQPVSKELGLESVTVKGVDEAASDSKADHVLTVYGADHPGIVAAVTHPLAERGVNITDLDTRLVGSADNPLYAMVLELELPSEEAESELKEILERVAEEAGVEVSLRQISTDTL